MSSRKVQGEQFNKRGLLEQPAFLGLLKKVAYSITLTCTHTCRMEKEGKSSQRYFYINPSCKIAWFVHEYILILTSAHPHMLLGLNMTDLHFFAALR